MGVDTKAVVLTKDKPAFESLTLITGALDSLILAEKRIQFPSREQMSVAREQFGTCDVRLHPSSEMAQVSFTFKGANRTISVFYSCDCDHTDLGPYSISMSMGASGESVLLMQTAVHALSHFGPAYLQESDSRGEMEPFQEHRPNLLQCHALGYLGAYSLTKWVERLKPTLLDEARQREVIGATISEIEERPDEELNSYWERLTAMAKRLEMPALRFRDEYHQRMCEA